jgi:hypothetical protein
VRKRQFEFNRKISGGGGQAIVEIPHFSILRHRSPKEVLASFEAMWGVKPHGVALPVVSHEGLLFNIEGAGLPVSPYAAPAQNLSDFPDVVEAFIEAFSEQDKQNPDLDIYLLLNPSLSFYRPDPLHVVDIVGDSSSHVCIGNPQSCQLLAAILGTAVDFVLGTIEETKKGKLKGVAVNTNNLWPMGASDERMELTCFCASCERRFERRERGFLKRFKNFPNPWSLMLQDAGTGISYISDIRSTSDVDDILGLSRQKGFIKIFKDAPNDVLRAHAEDLITYMDVRHKQVIDSLNDIFEQALEGVEEDVTRILLAEGVAYNWTAGLFFDRLDEQKTLGGSENREIWFNPTSSETFMSNTPFRSYMWRRSSYYIDAFFSLAAGLSDPVMRSTTGVARLGNDEGRDLLRDRLGKALGTALTERAALATLPALRDENPKGLPKEDQSQRIGFVGVMLDKDVGESLVEGLKIPEGIKKSPKGLDPLLALFEEMAKSAKSKDDD